jgi:hypothetical protein
VKVENNQHWIEEEWYEEQEKRIRIAERVNVMTKGKEKSRAEA